MLYGNENVQKVILEKVKEFEYQKQKKVIFGSMVGSISKGVERYDSDYDTRFLYLDYDSEMQFKRWDRIDGLKENDIHICFVPTDTSGFYDKIAFWEATSFFDFLRNPILDEKYSVGLYHIVGWTMDSPYTWDPYGIANRIRPLQREMFRMDYEKAYYQKYIERCLSRKEIRMREYLYSAYYALAIKYMEKNKTFAPYYFDTIAMLCEDKGLVSCILEKKREYYNLTEKKINEKDTVYQRKMADTIICERDEAIDNLLFSVLNLAEKEEISFQQKGPDFVSEIIEIIMDAIERPAVKDVNEKDGFYVGGNEYRRK